MCRLAADRLDVDPDALPPELVDELWTRPAGVPLVVEELLHVMVGNGLLHDGPDGLSMIGTIQGEVPETLLRTVSGRMERLGEEGRSVLTVAAVLATASHSRSCRRLPGWPTASS